MVFIITDGSVLANHEVQISPTLSKPVFAKEEINYLPHFQAGGSRFFNVDSNNWATSLDLFVPLWQNFPSHLVFTHLRFYDRIGTPYEGNAHLGYRHLSDDEAWLYGLYGAFDYRKTVFSNYFRQLTFGMESWYKNFFIGANYYQPIGGRLKGTRVVDSEPVLVSVPANSNGNLYNILVTPDHYGEKAAGGGDMEIGYEFFKGFVGYVGGYYFETSGIDAIYGPKARLSYDYSLANGERVLKIFDKVGIEVGIQHDKPRGNIGYLSLNCRVGLLPNQGRLQGVARHMVDLVRRDVDIITSELKAPIHRGVPRVAVDSGGRKINVFKYHSGTTQDELGQVLNSINKNNDIVIADPIAKDVSNPVVDEWIKVCGGIVKLMPQVSIYSPHTGRQLSMPASVNFTPEPKQEPKPEPKQEPKSELKQEPKQQPRQELMPPPEKMFIEKYAEIVPAELEFYEDFYMSEYKKLSFEVWEQLRNSKNSNIRYFEEKRKEIEIDSM